MRILVLGGTRFIGPFVVRGLAAAGHEVLVFHRGEHEPLLPGRHVHGDFADFERHLPELREFEPEVVVDMLAVRGDDAARVGAFSATARWAVVPSSSDVYRAFGRIWRTEPGLPEPMPLTEDAPLREVVVNTDYDKVEVERRVRQLDLPVAILRLPATHGPGDFQHRLWSYLKRMDDDRPAILLSRDVAGWRRTRGYVEDVAHAIVLAATDESAAGGTFNVADPFAESEAEWVRSLAAVTGWEGAIVAAEPSSLPAYLSQEQFDWRQNYVVGTSLIRATLGYRETVDAAEGLRRTVAWERENPPDSEHPYPEFADLFDYDAEDAVLRRLRS